MVLVVLLVFFVFLGVGFHQQNVQKDLFSWVYSASDPLTVCTVCICYDSAMCPHRYTLKADLPLMLCMAEGQPRYPQAQWDFTWLSDQQRKHSALKQKSMHFKSTLWWLNSELRHLATLWVKGEAWNSAKLIFGVSQGKGWVCHYLVYWFQWLICLCGEYEQMQAWFFPKD